MSSTIDYQQSIARCPVCDSEEEVTIIREQDNKSGEISYCVSGVQKCIECGHKFTYADVE